MAVKKVVNKKVVSKKTSVEDDIDISLPEAPTVISNHL